MMGRKIIDLSRTVYDICREDQDIIGILDELGFHDIAKPGMLNTAGRFMTIPKGAAMKKINLDKIKEIFQNYGYELKD